MVSVKKYIPPAPARLFKRLFLTVRGFYYQGNKYTCPICGHSFRKMLPGGYDLPVIREKHIVGAGHRENDICPYCQSTDRDRLLFLFLQNETDFFSKPNLVLHIAPEPALYRVFSKAKNITYHPATKYSEGFYYSSKVETADLLDLRFDESTFDWVICNHVLEHIPNDQKAMAEIFRVLKPNGKAILQVPISLKLEKTFEDDRITTPQDREKYFGQFDHVRIYGTDYVKRLETAGFIVHKIRQDKHFTTVKDLRKYAVNPEEIIFLCEKPGKKVRL